MRIAYYPFKNHDNKYTSIIIETLNSIEGVEVRPFSIKRFLLFSKEVWNSDIIWLNWFETVSSGKKAFIRLFCLCILKLIHKKIMYTLHNKKPHLVKQTFLLKFLQYGLYHFSDTIIIHSKLSMDEVPDRYQGKTRLIPHPNYINVYGEIVDKNEELEKDDVLKLLFIGQVKPYKNIELLISSLSKFNYNEVTLTIAGKPMNDNYKNSLEKISNKQKNIHLSLKFIEDDCIGKYLFSHDLIILPYDIRSSLNSGTVMLAFSYMKTVICPRIGTLEEMRNKKFISYVYQDEDEHEEKLIECIDTAIKLKKRNLDIFNIWGKIMFKEVFKYNSKTEIKRLLKKEICTLN